MHPKYNRPYLNLEDRLENWASYKTNIHDRHHILPTSIWWVNESENIIMIRQTTHRALHTVFGNGWPKEQQDQMLRINRKILADEIVNRIEELLDIDTKFWYKDGIRLPR